VSENKFKAFLRERQPFGDGVDLSFVDEALDDPRLPDATSWEHLKAYLDERGADEKMFSAAKYVWGLYVTSIIAWAG